LQKFYSMKKLLSVAIVCLLAACAGAQKDKDETQTAQSPDKMENMVDSLSYALGVTIGKSLTESGIEDIDYDQFVQAVKDAKTGDNKMELEMADQLIRTEMQRIQDMKAEAAKADGVNFLEENKSKDGIEVTASGLQYKVITEGSGESPSETDEVTVHYTGTLIDGTVFDSSVERGTPATFAVNRVIPGWTEGLQLMKPGGKRMFYIPQELAYGGRQAPGGAIPAFSALIFEVELLEVVTK
jgi:FKBP-type peptidyl-prolyl cis-trans isomerase